MRSALLYLSILLSIPCSLVRAATTITPNGLSACFAATSAPPFQGLAGFSLPAKREPPSEKATTSAIFSQNRFYSVRGNEFFETPAVDDGRHVFYLVDPTYPPGPFIWGSGRAENGEAGARIFANLSQAGKYAVIADKDRVTDPAVAARASELFLGELRARLMSLLEVHSVFGDNGKWMSEDWIVRGNVESLRHGLCTCEGAGIYPEIILNLRSALIEGLSVQENDETKHPLRPSDLACEGATS